MLSIFNFYLSNRCVAFSTSHLLNCSLSLSLSLAVLLPVGLSFHVHIFCRFE